MEVQKTFISDLLVLIPKRHEDGRGFFSESWNKARMQEQGLNYDFVQDNHSLSREVGTLRGLHYQSPPAAQDKLVRCGRGAIFDVAVDFRKSSPTFGQWFGLELTPENGKQLLIPQGFLHGFATRKPDSEIIYKCSDYYSPECDGAIAWNDPDIAIDWNVSTPVLSEKDAKAPMLSDIVSPF